MLAPRFCTLAAPQQLSRCSGRTCTAAQLHGELSFGIRFVRDAASARKAIGLDWIAKKLVQGAVIPRWLPRRPTMRATHDASSGDCSIRQCACPSHGLGRRMDGQPSVGEDPNQPEARSSSPIRPGGSEGRPEPRCSTGRIDGQHSTEGNHCSNNRSSWLTADPLAVCALASTQSVILESVDRILVHTHSGGSVFPTTGQASTCSMPADTTPGPRFLRPTYYRGGGKPLLARPWLDLP